MDTKEEIRNELLNAEMSLMDALKLMSTNSSLFYHMIVVIRTLLTETIEGWDKEEL